jgi:hypothetical protein
VLREKAKCERAMGVYERFFETLRLAYENDPFDTEIRGNLAEAYVYYGEAAKAITLIRHDPSRPPSVREQVALAVSLVETGALAEARPVLQRLMGDGLQRPVSPVVLLALGKVFAARPDGAAEASSYLERFVAVAARPENTLVDGWDPYRSQEKLDGARKLLATLKASPRRGTEPR